MAGIAFGSFDDSFSWATIKAYIAEFISTFLFVFAGVGSAIAFNKLTSDGALDPSGLVAIAVCHGFALFVAVSVGANISGGHVNPAVTFGLAVGGQITIITSILYWVAQLVGSIAACFLLKFVTGGLAVPIHAVGAEMGSIQGLVMEIVITFALVYTVYATAADPKKGSLGTIAPLAIGLIVGANILAAGPFSGGSMNPARSFGPAVASGAKMAFFLNKTSLISGTRSSFSYQDSEVPSLQSKRQYHIEPGTREKALLLEDPILKRFKSQKRNVKGLKRMGEVLTIVVVAGCCYQIYVKSVMRKEAQRQPPTANGLV